MPRARASRTDGLNGAGSQQASGVGPRIKALRTARSVSLRQLADMIGTTASFISQLERNLCGANTPTLMKIAAALDLGINDLFEDNGRPPHKVLTREHRPVVPVGVGGRKMLLSRRPIHEFEVYAGHFEVGGSTGAEAYTHGGDHEMFIVLKGTVELTLGDESHIMGEGDSVEYATSTPHRTVNVGDTPAEVLWIIAPPTSGAVELDQYRPGNRSHPGE
ncbi:transcriptional regulator, XRE family with cupin sensor [Mesorhizobium albiziae]|uniref:Transcriptional regulator, XRE family with cupin sensor n=1 Tax=Neomesorhizobium albiziae TaxID=335020 RepID=A0A1I4DZM6_9HYPH|nr:XRE family transcriptional regulator [Mesorhizobium albiziae]GLS31203.1 cupin [Mesorhizobium albiziae]SFK98915.1 transcriptional regulator, XRE family with cupin sensor [Mesorhizobium albiziae]